MAEIDKFEMMEVLTKKQEEERQRKAKAKKRNYIVGFSITAALLVCLAVIYTLSATIWLVDVASLPYVTYSYSADNNGEKTATITKFNPEVIEKDGVSVQVYPHKFVIPKTVNGLKVTGIANSAFANFTELETIIMPDTIEYIGDYAFYGCTNLKNITFSKNISHLGEGAFDATAYWNNLSESEVHVIADILYKVGSDVIEPNTVLLYNEDSYIPDVFNSGSYKYIYMEDWGDEINQWSNALFADNDNVVYVEIPSFINEIPENSFKNCKNLMGVGLTDSTTRIGDGAFSNCTSLIHVEINESVISIGSEAFLNTGISDITLPSTMENIGSGAFKNCLNIVNFTWPSNLNIPVSAFEGCTNLTSFSFDESGYEQISAIGSKAFKDTSLSEFTFPKNVQVIAESVLENVDELETVYLYQGKLTYDHYDNEVLLGVTRIEPNAFKGSTGQNSKLSSIILLDDNKNKVTPAGELNFPISLQNTATSSSSGSIFANTSVSKVTFPANVSKTAPDMFANDLNLKEVNFELKHVGTQYVGMKYIGFRSFYNTGLENIVIPNTVETIESNAFENSAMLKNVTLPDETSKFTTISSSLFAGCVSLESVNINSNIYTIKQQAFVKNYSLNFVYIPFNDLSETASDDAKSKLTIEPGTFAQAREEGSDTKLAIFLNIKESNADNNRMPSPIFEVDNEGNYVLDEHGERIMKSAGWYDDTCKVYWKGMWEFNDQGVPTPIVG